MFLSISIKTIVLKFIVTQINEGDFSFNWKFLKKIIDCGKIIQDDQIPEKYLFHFDTDKY
jgi:hypothetical protein